MKIEILYENEDLLIANKPAGLLVVPDRFDQDIPSMNRVLEQQLGQRVWVVHRLDRNTSGVICFAKNEEMHRYLSKVFQEHNAGKHYVGLVNGRLLQEEGVIESPISEHPTKKGTMVIAKRGKPSITEYKLEQAWPLYSLVNFTILTGRTHQIRVHMQSLGHAIVCDDIYGDGKPFLLSKIKKNYHLSNKYENERPLLSRLALHAKKLSLPMEDGSTLTVEAPLPKDINACVNQLNKWARLPL